ncbi:MAG: hypothetical protein KF685_07930 [Acidobacteria bacterium]|nr:hypothetical protein [Acidobacteriota bacterium]
MEQVLSKNNNFRLFGILFIAAVLLSVPFVAMQFTGEVKWGIFDFIVAGILLFGSGLAIEMALRIVTGFWTRIAACAAILLLLLIVWAELAVGIFGTPLAGS